MVNPLKLYYQVPLNPKDIPRYTITTPFDTFNFNYSCFGLRNGEATFQYLMNGILWATLLCMLRGQQRGAPLSPTYCARSPTTEWLCCLVRQVYLGANEVLFSGHRISPEVVYTFPRKVAAVQNFSTLSTFKALQELFGNEQLLSPFPAIHCRHSCPLYSSLNGKPKDQK
ncbi:uncharacterized protein [Palaemon carinicauda]|uniref:uncharacterized protein n=1 Tax=Palaemon carinicauda TaxID=392227 RepID=UPI0035B5D597